MRGRGSIAQNPVGAVIEIEPGQGNLSAKVYMAAVIGPQRVAFGAIKVFSLSESKATQVASNSSASAQICFMSMSLQVNNAGPLSAMVSNGAMLGLGNLPVRLVNLVASAGGNSFTSILLPGEELWASSGPGAGTFNVVVSTNWF
jgi:hypothetical protein